MFDNDEINLPTQEVNLSEATTEEKTSRFVKAREITLHTQENPEAEYNCIAHFRKALVNDVDIKQIFNVVAPGYKLVQHDEAYDAVVTTVDDLGFNTEKTTIEMNDGARLRLIVKFPDLTINLPNDVVSLSITVDNSYNYTTGLRCSIDGWIERDKIKIQVKENFSYFYHKHTKGLEVADLIPSVEKGIEVFKTKIKAKFEKYCQVNLNPARVVTFLEKIVEDKELPKKYAELLVEKAKKTPVNTQWELYKLINEVLSHECDKVDAREKHAEKMDIKMNANLSTMLNI